MISRLACHRSVDLRALLRPNRWLQVTTKQFVFATPYAINNREGFQGLRHLDRVSVSDSRYRWIHLTPSLLDEEIDVKTPEFPDSISEGDVKWMKKVGDAVKAEEIVLEIETEKTAIPVPSPSDGVIVEQYVKQDQVIRPDTKLFKLKVAKK